MKNYSLLIITTIFLILIIANNSSAFYLWEKFGNNLTTYTQSQSLLADGDLIGIIQNYNSTIFTYSTGIIPIQPIIASMGTNDTYAVIGSNDGYLKILDSSLNQLSSINSSLLQYQIELSDFDNDGIINDISGIFLINSTAKAFKTYNYNITTNILSLIRQQNFTSLYDVAGLRCKGVNCYFLKRETGNNYTLYSINSSAYSTKGLPIFQGTIREPFSIDDYDNDGNDELYGWGEGDFFTFSLTGTKEFYMTKSNFTGGSVSYVAGSKPIYYGGSWKFLINIYGSGLCATGGNVVYSRNYNMSDDWNKLLVCTPSATDTIGSSGIALSDYNNDGITDVYSVSTIAKASPSTNHTSNYKILSGNNGTILYEKYDVAVISSTTSSTFRYPNTMITLARIGNYSNNDIIFSTKYNHAIFSPTISSYIMNNTYTSAQIYSCIPADLDKDNKQEVVCSFNGFTKVYGNNGTSEDRNPVVNSILLSDYPAIVNQPLLVTILATDDTNATINYTFSCDGSGYSLSTTNNTYICYYGSEGIYNFSVGVKDLSHSYFDYYFADILATLDGEICNFNGICDVWEDNETCYTDCSGKYTTATGGTPLPLTLVSIDNENEGLLPEIYNGMSVFFSYIAEPLIIIIFLIFFVLIGFALSVIITKLGKGLLN